VGLGCGWKHFLTKSSNPIFDIRMIGFGHFFLWVYIQIKNALKKKVAKSLLQVFFAVVNGGRSVDARRIFTQFLIPMSWAKHFVAFFFH
jgi:hypothetical protein